MVVIVGLAFSGAALAQLPRNVEGKVFFTSSTIQDISTKALVRRFEKEKANAELKRNKNGHWTVTIAAFLRRKPHPGPITIWLYDKQDKAALKAKEPVNAISVDGRGRSVFIHELDISPDLGFNKGRVYYVYVGQILGKRDKVFARGEVELLAERGGSAKTR
jgi:hypothetical protein